MSETTFYSFSSNSCFTRGVPGVYAGHAESRVVSECSDCGTRVTRPVGTIRLQMEPEKGTLWPDVLWTSGGFMGLYVSERVVGVLRSANARFGDAFPALVERPYPRKLKKTTPAQYFLITGECGAKYDFAASGYAIKSVCPACGRIKHDPASRPTRDQFLAGTWNGSDIFYTDLSPSAHFCTERILDLARSYRWTNFRFVPLEDSYNYSHRGVDYLKSTASG